MKLLEEKFGKALQSIDQDNSSLNRTPGAQEVKSVIDKCSLLKLKTLIAKGMTE